MSPELYAIIEETDNPLEAFFAAIIFYLIEVLFKIIEVVVEFGENTQESD